MYICMHMCLLAVCLMHQFVRPLYKDLCASRVGNDVAFSTFEEHRAEYHPIAAKMIAAVS